MPIDLLADNSGASQSQGPIDLLANPTGASLASARIGELGGNALQGALNSPHDILSLGLNAAAAPAQGVYNLLPKSIQGLLPAPQTQANQISSAIPQANWNVSQMVGINQPTVLDKLIGGAGQVAGSSLAPLGALKALSGVQGGISGIGTGISNYMESLQAPKMFKQVANDLTLPNTLSNNSAFDQAALNKQNLLEQNQQDFNNRNTNVVTADQNHNFDDTSYKNYLSDRIQTLQDQSKQSGLAAKNSDTITMLQGLLNDPHSTYADAFMHNQGINALYGAEMTPGKSLPFSEIKGAHNALQQTIQQNLDTHGLQDTLGQNWSNANEGYKKIQQIFQTTPKMGRDPTSDFQKYLSNNSEYSSADRGNFINEHLPNGTSDSLGRMQQLGDMLGDPETAKALIKRNYFDTDNGIQPNNFFKQYQKLSQPERQYLFDPDTNSRIEGLMNVNDRNPGALNAQNFTPVWKKALLGGAKAVGYGLTGAAGMKFLK